MPFLAWRSPETSLWGQIYPQLVADTDCCSPSAATEGVRWVVGFTNTSLCKSRNEIKMPVCPLALPWVIRLNQMGHGCHLGLSSAWLRVPSMQSLSRHIIPNGCEREPLSMLAPPASFKSLLMIPESGMCLDFRTI